MKKLSSGVAAIAFLSLIACNEAPKTTTITPKNWDLVITSMTTKHMLDSVSTAWAKDSIDFKITKLENDSTGKLLKVGGTVNVAFVKGGMRGMSGAFSDTILNQRPFEIKMDNSPKIWLGYKN